MLICPSLNGRQKIKDDAFADRTIISIPMEFRVHDSSGVEARFSSAEVRLDLERRVPC